MAGANNRSLKAAGLPKKTVDQIRVARGAGMSVKSAIQHAQAHGLPLGKAKGGELTGWQKAAAGATTHAEHAASRAAREAHVAAEGRKAALKSAMESRQRNLTRALDAASQTTLTRRLVRQHMAKLEARQNAEAARPKWSPKGRQNTPDNAQRLAGMLQAGTAAVRAAGTPEKGMVHVYNPDSGKTATLKALSTKGSAVVVRDRVRQASGEPAQYQVIHKGTGIGIGNYYKTSAGAAEAAKGVAKSLDKTIERMKSGDVRAGEALYKYSVRKRGQIAARPSPQEARAEAKRIEKEASAAKEAEFKAQWQAKNDRRDERKLGIAQRLTRMYSKARAAVGKAGWEVYHAQLDAKKNGLEPLRQAESKAAALEARVKHLEMRAKKLRVDPKRTYKNKYDLLY